MRKVCISAMSGKRIYLCVVLVPLIAAIIGTLLLSLVSLIPDSLVYDHAYASAYQIADEGENPKLHSPAGHREYSPDNFTDSLIMQTSYTLTADKPSNILLNAIATEPHEYTQPKYLVNTVEGNVTGTQSYSRYWMGFRILYRPLLIFTAYYGIRSIIAAFVLMLLLFAVLTTAERNSPAAAAALALSFALVEPYAVCSCLQFSCCFALAFAFVIAVNLSNIELRERRAVPLFCLFGALTQFFDFYTYPVITFAFPMLVLAARAEGKGLWKRVLGLFGLWLSSYVMMWLVKLGFVSLFTSDAGFGDAFAAAFGRFGIGEYRLDNVSYKISDAMPRAWSAMSSLPFLPVLTAVLVVLGAAVLCRVRRALPLGRMWALLTVAVLPVAWMLATPQPIYIHYWFQYRSVCASYFALLLFICEGFGLNVPRLCRFSGARKSEA